MISKEYKNNLKILQNNNSFKNILVKYDPIKNFVSTEMPESILDYGCAKGNLIKQLKIDFPTIRLIDGYDPGVEEFEIYPQNAYDCLISNDVLEHIEPMFLNETLSKIEELFTKSAWFIIACYPAKKILPDGRNAHLIQESPDWWKNKINTSFKKSKIVHWEIVEFAPNKPEIRVILRK